MNDLESEGYHRMNLRYSMTYHRYLEGLAFRTRLDITQLIRLMIHLSPKHEEFKQIVEQYVRPDRKAVILLPDFDNPNMWKRC